MRYFGGDILSWIKTYLESNLNNMLDTISSERSLSTSIEHIISFEYGRTRRQYPECIILMKDSKTEIEELNIEIEDTPEDFPIDIMVLLKENSEGIYIDLEYYIEALQRIFHGYKDDYISWVIVTGSIRADAFNEQNEILKVVGVSLNIRVL